MHLFIVAALVVGVQYGYCWDDSVLEIYNPDGLVRVWHESTDQVSDQCFTSMDSFLGDLKDGRTWAIKLAEASGRYPSNFFAGNDFWMGSRDLCRFLSSEGEDPNATFPFPLQFHVATVRFNLTLENVTESRKVQIGLCLPRSCSSDDAWKIIEISADVFDTSQRSVQMIKIRTLGGSTNTWKDPALTILLIVLGTAYILVVIGTIFDMVPQLKQICGNNYSYEVNKTPLGTSEKVVAVSLETSNKEDSKTTECNSDTSQNPSGELQIKSNATEKGLLARILLSYSMKTNMKNIFNLQTAKGEITMLNGMRFWCMIWLIEFHTVVSAQAYADNRIMEKKIKKDILYQGMINATFAVDNFYILSGLLLTLSYLHKSSKTKNTQRGIIPYCKEYIMMVVRRYLRLTPPYAFALLLMYWSSTLLYNNATFEPYTPDIETCPKYWWRNMLYIQNFFRVEDMCMKWSWYLANDFQFFLLGLALLMLADKFFSLAVATLVVILSSALAGCSYFAYIYDLKPGQHEQLLEFDTLFDKPWGRLGPYAIGMVTGWIIFKVQGKEIKINAISRTFLWSISLFLVGITLYGPFCLNLGPVVSALYIGFSRFLYAAAYIWAIVASCIGYGGIPNSLGSWKYLLPFSRLTYCVYLIHPIVMRTIFAFRASPIHITVPTMALFLWGNVVLCYVVALFVCLLFEEPMISLIKIFFPNRRKSSTRQQ